MNVKPRRVLHGFIDGVLVGLVFVEMVALAVLLYAEAPVGDATVALGTLTLAVATAGLALATFALVRTTADEMNLIRQQTTAITAQAAIARDQLDELREARFAEFLPVLHWQLHPGGSGARSTTNNEGLRLEVAVLLTNVARAPARLTSLKIEVAGFPEEEFRPAQFVSPSTLPGGERIELVLWQRRQAGDFPGERKIHLNLMYADMANFRHYQTNPTVTVRWALDDARVLELDADDLSPSEREYDQDMHARWADQR